MLSSLRKLSWTWICQPTPMYKTSDTYARRSTFHQLWFICWQLCSTMRHTTMLLCASVSCAPFTIWWCEMKMRKAVTIYLNCQCTWRARVLQSSKRNRSTMAPKTPRKMIKTQVRRATKNRAHIWRTVRSNSTLSTVVHILDTNYFGSLAFSSKAKSFHLGHWAHLSGDVTSMISSDSWQMSAS